MTMPNWRVLEFVSGAPVERYNEMLLEIEFWARQESDEIFEFFNDLYHKLDEFKEDIEKLQ